MELVQKTWTKLLIHWMNRCVNPELHVKALASSCLVEVINKYKEDIVDDDIDRAILCTDDLEPFLRYKYPILRLRYFTEEKDATKKLYIMTSVLLYHCCISSHTGAVENDICSKLPKDDREMILRFCESLSDMEITINNVDVAIEKACEIVPKPGPSKTVKRRSPTPHVSKAAVAETVSETESAVSDVSSKKIKAKKVSTLTFKASVTVMPSHISKTSLQPDSSLETSDTYSLKLDDFSESTTVDSVTTFNVTENDPASSVKESEKSRKSENSLLSCRTDDTKKSVNSKRSKKDVKLPAEQGATMRAIEARDKEERQRYRDTYHKPESPIGSRKYSPEASGDKAAKLKREVCNITTEQPVAATASSESKNDPCCCVISTSDDMSDDMTTVMGYIPSCRACVDTTDTPMKKKTLTTGVHLAIANFYSYCKGKTYVLHSSKKWVIIGILLGMSMFLLLGLLTYMFWMKKTSHSYDPPKSISLAVSARFHNFNARKSHGSHCYVHPTWAWQCTTNLCMKVYKPIKSSNTFSSLSRCILLCTGPQLWPYPIGMVYFSKALVGLTTDRIEYKFEAVPSDMVNQYLAEAFKLFLGSLSRLEKIDIKNKNHTHDIVVKKMHITMEVESDSDPRIRVNTDESYYLKLLDRNDRINININSPSFAGVRHGLETLSQVILLDQSTGHLVTLTDVIIKDAPSYKYRGLMLDTARNYIPVHDILRTIDGMATCKLNTFHWRITDSASFPLLLPSLVNLFEYGAYDRRMVYTKEDVKKIVSRAGVRGIRVLMEVAIPGPVGRAWSWSSDATCPKMINNFTCENIICIRLKMQYRVFELLQHLYSEIIDMTGVDDMFHLSDGVFSLSNCYYQHEEREGFLEKALERLRLANKGFLPKVPIIWYTQHLNRETEARLWDRYGVQVYDWPTYADRSFKRYRVIHSGRWDLSCYVKKQRCTKYRSWQEMYSWKTWRNFEVFSIEGGEALLWTDLVDSGNLDFHLWPRAAAVAERLWSDLIANGTASGDVYIRLDNHRWRMLLRGMQVQPIWPVWCSFNPASCLSKLRLHMKK